MGLGLGDDDATVHVHYSCDMSLASSRRARRQLLRYMEMIVREATSRDDAGRLLSGRESEPWAIAAIRCALPPELP